MATLELTNNLLAEIGGWPALKEARVLVERGRVREANRDGPVIRARIQGAEKVYDAQITLADRVANIEVRCTCAESRRSGRVCAHALAAGLALLRVAVAGPRDGPAQGLRRLPSDEGTAAQPAAATVGRLPRVPLEEALPGTPRIELTILLPLQLPESLAKDPVRIILEARRDDEGQAQPFDTAMRGLGAGFSLPDEDERVLAALEQITGAATGINAVPRARIGSFLRALADHPRVWLGKKQRVEVRASADRPGIIFSTHPDGALALKIAAPISPIRPLSPKTKLPIPNWTLDGAQIIETAPLPPGFSSASRLIPPAQIPNFLTREFPALERTCELVFAPGFEEFRLEIGQPTFEARLEGALSGLTLELIARYADQEFSLNGKTESSAYQRYISDPRIPNLFWRRNILAEREALAQVEASGFSLVRGGATTFSLISENQVARFLANTLPRWRRIWTVHFGPRLEATMAEVDVAQPEFSLRSGSGEDWLSLDLKLSVGGKPIALDQSEIQRWLQTGQTHARTSNKRVLLVPTEAWSEMKEVLADCEVDQEPGKIRVTRTYAPYLAGALTAQGFRTGENVAADISPPDVKAALDEKLWAQLRPYQAQGVEWLASLAQRNFHGLLADDMGLGKTLQALAFCAWLGSRQSPGDGSSVVAAAVPSGGAVGSRRSPGDGSSVVAAAVPSGGAVGSRQSPGDGSSVVAAAVPSGGAVGSRQSPGDGSSEVAAAVPSGGAVGSRRSPSDGPPLGTTAATTEATLVVCPTSLVTNWLRETARFTPHLRTLDLTGPDRAEKFAKRNEYDLLVTSYAILRRDIEQYRADEFLLVILDEAQHIKNRGSQNAQSAKALRSRHRLILTGTPLENSVLDLWSLYDFLLPGYLGTAADFRERYETPLMKAGAPDTQPKLMERLRHRMRPFFLRRTKEEVLTELPPKLEFPTLCELTAEQREVYRAVLAQGRREVFEHSDKAGRKSGRDRIAVLTTLLRLRQVCCHLDLLPAAPPLGTAAATTETTPRRWKEPSAKMDRTFELIDEAMDGGHRVLLFSQFVRVLHLLRDEARKRELRFCYLDGQTVERQAEVDRFQNDADIPLFFISLKAGGTGLNLTGADTVIHFDPWWNPAVEEQATSRAHRMGQARSVQAYKLIAAGTVEEKIQALQARKRELFQASLGGDEAFVEKLTGEDLEELLTE